MIQLNLLDRQSAQVHRLMSLLDEDLLVAEVEMVLAKSELLVKKWTIPRESAIPEEEKKVVLSSGVLLCLGALGGLPLSLTTLGGIDTCFGTSGLCRFASLLIQQKFHKYKCDRVLMKFWLKQ